MLIKMKKYIGIAIFVITILFMWMPVHTEAASLPIYLRMTEQHVAYTGPGTTYDPMGYVEKNTIAIVYAMTDNYWYRIYYKGQIGYISHDNVRLYLGCDGEKDITRQKLPEGQIRMAVLGDSITAGEGLTSQQETYAAQLGNMLGAVAIQYYGVCGSAMAGAHPERFLDRYPLMNPEANLILVLGGTNDYGFDTPLGHMGDRTGDTFYGGLNQLMCGLGQLYPNAQIVFLTPLKREKDTRQNAYGNSLSQYAQAVVEMADFYHYKVVDVYTPPELNFAGQMAEYMKDGIHPTAKAHHILAEYVYKKLIS